MDETAVLARYDALPNKLMRRLAGRDLIHSDAAGYRLHPADAAIVLEAWPADQPGQDDRQRRR